MRLLENKVAIVTGAGQGIGRATALTFSRDGASVLVADRNAETGQETVRLIREAGGDACFVEVDVTSRKLVDTMVEEALDRWGRLDCAVNNAAYNASYGMLGETGDEGWDKTNNATLKAVFLAMRAEINAMRRDNSGAIVNISSMAALKGEVFQAPYSAAKAGVLGLTYTAAAEYAQYGIRINAICPGGVATPGIEKLYSHTPDERRRLEATHAMRRLGRPEEIADAAAYLCSDRSSFITGHALPVDGGLRINHYLM